MLKLCIANPGATPQLLGDAVYFGGAERRSILLAEMIQKNHLAEITFVTTVEVQKLNFKTISTQLTKQMSLQERFQNRIAGFIPFVAPPVTIRLDESAWRAEAFVVFGVSTFAYSILEQCKRRNKKFVLVITSDDCLECELSLKIFTEKNPYSCPRWMGYKLINSANQIWTQTNYQNENLIKKFGIKGSIIMNPLSFIPPEFTPKYESREGVLWIGKNNEVKDPLTGLRIARQLPTIKFTFIINGFRGSELEKFTEKERLSNVYIIECASSLEIRDLMKSHKILLNTSMFEGMPNTFLEAWSHGTPIVSLKASENLFNQNKGLGVHSNNSEIKVIQDILEIYNDESKWNFFSNFGKNHVLLNHTNEKILQDLKTCIEQL